MGFGQPQFVRVESSRRWALAQRHAWLEGQLGLAGIDEAVSVPSRRLWSHGSRLALDRCQIGRIGWAKAAPE